MTRFLKSLFTAPSSNARRSLRMLREARNSSAEILEHRTLLASQVMASDMTARTVSAGDTIDVPVLYSTLDDNGDPADLRATLLSGNLHFDSSVLTYVSSSDFFAEDIVVVPNSTRLETDAAVTGDDGDAATDTVIVSSYSDTPTPINPEFTGWPNQPSTTPLTLYIARFTVNAGFTGSTNINFSANATGNVVGQAAAFDFAQTSLVLSAPTPNADPTITSAATMTVAENQTAAIDVDATDSDGDTLTYSISGGSDSSLFGINGSTGVITFNSAPDFESPGDAGANNVYDVQVSVTDGNGGTVTQDIAITVADVFENIDPVITSGDSASVPENQTSAISVQATDGNGDTLSYALSGTDASLFSVSNTGVVTFNSAPDFEAPADAGSDNIYNFTVTVSDTNGGSAIQAVAITVTDVRDTNDDPVITSGNSATVTENQTSAIDVVATDGDGDTLSYSLSGDDASLFSISASGVVTFNVAPDFEMPGDTGTDNVYNFTVGVDDNNGGTASQAIAITVTDVRDTNVDPVITSSAAASVNENQTSAITVVATDGDGDTLTYSLSGDDAALFSVSQTGVVTFNSAPDFEAPGDTGADNIYNFAVTVNDGNAGTASQNIAITVLDVLDNLNQDPVITSPNAASVEENQTSAITVTATDADGDTISYFIAGTDAALFSISAGGIVTFAAAPDFESPSDSDADNVYNFAVTATDGNGGSTTQDVAITVTDVEEMINTDGTIYGRKFNDVDGDGTRDDGEEWLNGWTIQLVNQSGVVVQEQVTADVDLNNDGSIDPSTERGVYLFTAEAGTYELQEVAQEGWIQTAPTDSLAATAYQLDQQFSFVTSQNDFLNWGGLNERWLWGSGDWYFVTPAGSLFRWDGSPQTNLTGTHIADLSSDFHTNLSLLTEAEPAQSPNVILAEGGMVRVDFGNQLEDVMPPTQEYPGRGNVRAVAVANRTLLLSGDASGVGVRVYLNDSGYVTVDGMGETTINGESSPWVLDGWTSIPQNLLGYFGRGDDAVVVEDVQIGNSLIINTANGNDYILVDDAHIGGNATAVGAAGNNNIVFKDTQIDGNYRVTSGAGTDAVYTSGVSVGGRTLIRTLGGHDIHAIGDSTFYGSATFDAGAGNDSAAVTGMTTFNDSVTVFGRSGTDAIDVAAGTTFAETPTVSSVEEDSIADVDGLLDSIMESLARAGLSGLLD